MIKNVIYSVAICNGYSYQPYSICHPNHHHLVVFYTEEQATATMKAKITGMLGIQYPAVQVTHEPTCPQKRNKGKT